MNETSLDNMLVPWRLNFKEFNSKEFNSKELNSKEFIPKECDSMFSCVESISASRRVSRGQSNHPKRSWIVISLSGQRTNPAAVLPFNHNASSLSNRPTCHPGIRICIYI